MFFNILINIVVIIVGLSFIKTILNVTKMFPEIKKHPSQYIIDLITLFLAYLGVFATIGYFLDLLKII